MARGISGAKVLLSICALGVQALFLCKDSGQLLFTQKLLSPLAFGVVRVSSGVGAVESLTSIRCGGIFLKIYTLSPKW